MNIKSIRLRNFKRFTDLTLQAIPSHAQLVLLIGGNGSGKSSIFDAFEAISRAKKGNPTSYQNTFQTVDRSIYFRKDHSKTFEIVITNQLDISVTSTENTTSGDIGPSSSFYGRSSFRQVPLLTRRFLGQHKFDIEKDDDRPAIFVDRDVRFENDIEKISGYILDEVFQTDQSTTEIREKYINQINSAFKNIFGSDESTTIQLTHLSPALEGKVAKLLFRKGNSQFHYNNLSAGEKEIFNILLNLIARRKYFQDSIYFFDEIDLHLNTKLQYNFIKEIVEQWIPPNCQFWTASHSLGFIQYAKESGKAVIFDFANLNFDIPTTLIPEAQGSADLYEIAISKEILPHLFRDRKIVFVENQDKQYYASLSNQDAIFVAEKNRDAVFFKAKTNQYNGLVDRDFLTDDDIRVIEQQYPTLKILRLYCIENYLYHPENLSEYYFSISQDFDKKAYIDQIDLEKEKYRKDILIKVATIRQGYPYFKEPGMEGSLFKKRFTPDDQNYMQTAEIGKYLESSNVDQFLKSFSLKDYGKLIPERHHINPFVLSTTKWFNKEITELLS